MRRIALIVGNNVYRPDAFTPLSGAVRDAQEIAGFLKFRLPDESRFETRFLSNPPASRILDALLEILDELDEDSTFVFYFAGHGLCFGADHRQTLVCSDATRLVVDAGSELGTISPNVMTHFTRQARGNLFFIFDVCRVPAFPTRAAVGGAGEGSGALRDAVAGVERVGGGKTSCCWVLSSCVDGQQAGDDGEFVKALVETMEKSLDEGRGIRLGDDFVNELDACLKRRRHGLSQRPVAAGIPFELSPPDVRRSVPPKPDAPVETLWRVYDPTDKSEREFPESQLALAIAAGRVPPRVYLWTEGYADWTPVEQLPLFAGMFPKPDAPESATPAPATPGAEPAPASPAPAPTQSPTDGPRRAHAAANGASDAWSANLAPGARRVFSIAGVDYGFCWIPPGKFMMGSPETERQRDFDEKQRETTISKGFWMLETPVTQRLWKSASPHNPSCFKGRDLPVERVSYPDAVEFLDRLAKFCRLKATATFRLPTEAEWEYACRAGTTSAFYFGDTFNGEEENCDGRYPYGDRAPGVPVPKGPYNEKTSPVKSYKPNPWGLYDMHGNVGEWIADWYAPYPDGPAADPTGPASGCERVVRGGDWRSAANRCRAAYRDRLEPNARMNYLGFRFVLAAR